MEILAPSSEFISPRLSTEPTRTPSSALYAKRRERIPSESASSKLFAQNGVTESVVPVPTGMKAPVERCPPARLDIGFLPLPPILASPICTPTASSTCSQEVEREEQVGMDTTNRVSVRVTLVSTATPTWVSTPPTPPMKSGRHSGALSIEGAKAPTALFAPSASFPASMHAHAGRDQGPRVKKCISVPNLIAHNRAASEFPPLGSIQPSTSFPCRLRSLSQPMVFDIDHGRSAPHPKPIFSLHNCITDNDDDSADSPESRPHSLNDDTSPDGSWSDCGPAEIWEEEERSKDAARRYHALKELLSTEHGYVTDLRAFVTSYLRNLPTLAQRAPVFNSTFGRASASFSSGPWAHSYTQLHALASPSPMPESQVLNSPLSSIKDIHRSSTRYLFTDNELELVIRNAEDLLQLHEHFLKELTTIALSMGISMEHSDQPPSPVVLSNIDNAIRAVSAKFATEASRFNAYQSFCAGHLEALDLVRKVSQQHAAEWEAFEQRCSIMISDLEAGKVAESEPKSHQNTQVAEDRIRTLSLTSLDGAVRTLRLRCPTKDSANAALEHKREAPSPRRISFVDYMIKPIQRICKYPLLFDQLLSHRSLKPNFTRPRARSCDVDVVVKSASQAMRHVASSVDEARHRQDAAMQSALIASRMFLGGQMLLASSDPSIQTLTPEFLSSLGSCLLAGPLDVMHHHPLRPLESISNFKAKYLGAFLYPGGYLILAKVFKGRKYEPKHWFSLAEFTTSDVEEGEAILPYSIRVSCGEQHFELAASCHREKVIWLKALRESMKHEVEWTNEPTPSFKFDEKGGLISSLHSEPEISTGLPTIQSIPEMSKATSDTELSEPFLASLRSSSKSKTKLRRYEPPSRPEFSPSTSRRSSTTSVKSIFGPIASDPETIVIRRSSPVARLQVDQALQDVISPSCVNARMYAYSRDEELFRGTSNLGGTRSKSRLSKHESIRVPRSRTTDSLDSLPSRSPRKGNLASRRNAKGLTITPIIPVHPIEDEKPPLASPPEVPSSAPSSSQSHNPPSLVHTDTSSSTASGLLTPPTTSSNENTPHKSSRSLVRGVKDLFHFRPSPSPTANVHSNSSVRAHEPSASHQGSGVLHRWTMDTIRRRPRSVPEPLPEHTPDSFGSSFVRQAAAA
ncbi:hypothetical protein CC1G_01363 [Coprinopsis cinerea okayama7|uniref:DH domain-containing protein n=1 Tax=Coprinopsis cinerea (strain Okayama-7 / 130 / ATCC MYA-4618 / FGSC 9003) TaxID=240176 RepID=A8NYK4_COPC7|nr:hypothetical protein CC1G_01363 [Coprinopsis cinerea okayama7\|eukprot:XP_001837451.2 hypothetical protein CC1G_01363 [Coprinopsis cinerea okayama7\